MKKRFTAILLVLGTYTQAQVGIGTTSPNSTLDVRGALSLNLRVFTANATPISSTDNTVIFTGTAASTATLPDATTCAGRVYRIKNASTTSPTPLLTIATTASQTIDGISSWIIDEGYGSIDIVSNGTNWLISSQSVPKSSGSAWLQGGNGVTAVKNFGTISNYDLPFITNNTVKMRLTAMGSLGIGTSTFNGTYPERLIVDAGSTGNTNYQNVIVGKGNTNSYAQLNIQNGNAGLAASSDVVATADNGSETTNYVDLGINSSVNNSDVMGAANDAYLYNIGQNFLIGTGTAAKSLVFMTGGTTQSVNERLRIDGSGNIGIGINNPAYKLHVLAASNPLYLGGVQTGATTDSVLTIINGVVRKLHPSAFVASSWSLNGNSGTNPLTNFIGTTDNKSLRFRTNNIQRMYIDSATGYIGIGTTNTQGGFNFVTDGTDEGNNYWFDDYTNATTRQSFQIRKARGTVSSPINLVNGDLIGVLRMNGYSNGGFATNGGSGMDVYYKGNGTTELSDLRLLTNNTERIRLDELGSVGIGTSAFSSTFPERLLVDADTTGNTDYQNVIVGKGNTNSYAQLNIQNTNAGTAASSDVVATADNGNEARNYVDMGINSSANTQNYFGGINDAYLYSIGNGASTGGNLYIGTATASRDIAFLTGGGTKSSGVTMNNERMRILGTGNVGIANGSPTEKLDVTGNVRFSGALMPNNSAGTAGYFLQSMGAGTSPVWFDASGFTWQLNGNSVASIKTLGTTNAFDLPFITNNTEQMRITSTGNVGIGTSAFSGTFPEQLIVNAGTPGTITDYQNVIVGKGNTNSYAQLNIQNTYSAAANSASSDVVATSDNGNESVNFIDMGINSGTNTTSGVIGGANTAYLYTTGSNLAIGTTTASKDIMFFTGTSYTDRMHITSAGHLIPTANNTYNLGSASFRWATIYAQNTLNTSDARLKTNIRDLHYGLSTVLTMRPVQYNWKEGADKENKIGFLAQDLRKIIPEVVVGDENKETLAVNYIELIPVLVNAIKEQQKQIDDLKKRINVLEKR